MDKYLTENKNKYSNIRESMAMNVAVFKTHRSPTFFFIHDHTQLIASRSLYEGSLQNLHPLRDAEGLIQPKIGKIKDVQSRIERPW